MTMKPSYNIIFLTGLSGTGKSTVGKILAQKLEANFRDTDLEIQKKTGMKISDIFRKKGEKFFRFVESEVVRDVIEDAKRERTIVSLGGGAVTSPDNLHEIRKNGIIVNLRGNPETLAKRVSESGEERPLLEGGDMKEKLSHLLRVRKKWYSMADIFVDTDGKSPEHVADEIIREIERLRDISVVRVNLAERSYDILIGAGLIKSDYVAHKCKNAFEGAKKTFIATSRRIYELSYGDSQVGETLKDFFSGFGVKAIEFFLPEGETTKDIFYATVLWEKLAENDLKKNDFICLLGGGVVGDLGGFVASTWLRGIKYVNIPTTLLSQVDSAIGGKTGVNTKKAKNMVGTIYQPSLVLCDVNFTATLPEQEFLSGLGEVLKYAVSMSEELFNFLVERKNDVLARDTYVLREMISQCASLKAEVVSADEREELGLRMILNFGHTVAHAVESSMSYSIPHGIAVSFGILAETKIADLITGGNLYRDVEEFVRGFGLGSPPAQLNTEKFFDSMKLDKKTRGDKINFVLLEKVGRSRVVPLNISEFMKVAENALKELGLIHG